MATNPLALSGLASGVDTASIVAQLMAVERQKLTPITKKQTQVQAQQDSLKAITTRLSALKDAADALKLTGSAWAQTQTVESSDPTRVMVAKLSGAGSGGHTIQVDRLAASAQLGFAVGGLAADGTFATATSFTVGSKTFSIAAGATLGSVVDQINGSSDSPVYAAVIKNSAGQDRLVLSARSTGESSRFTVTAPGPLTADPVYTSPAGSLNAQYRLDGSSTVQESETNSVDNAIPGLRLTFKAVTSSPVSVSVGQSDIDRTAIQSKVKAFVDAYNAVVDSTRTELSEKSVPNATTTSDLQKGVLFGDLGLDTMLSNLRNGLRDTLTGLTGVDDLSDIGITVPAPTGGASSEDGKAGRFTLDTTKLSDALTADWGSVSKFLDSFATKVDTLVNRQTNGGTGILDQRVQSTTTSLKDLQSSLDAMNQRLDAEEQRYNAQFAAMETAMANYQNQQNWLTGQLNALG
jgi:flagellar hook-associated protein 2